jgi:hypothetical protein
MLFNSSRTFGQRLIVPPFDLCCRRMIDGLWRNHSASEGRK